MDISDTSGSGSAPGAQGTVNTDPTAAGGPSGTAGSQTPGVVPNNFVEDPPSHVTSGISRMGKSLAIGTIRPRKRYFRIMAQPSVVPAGTSAPTQSTLPASALLAMARQLASLLTSSQAAPLQGQTAQPTSQTTGEAASSAPHQAGPVPAGPPPSGAAAASEHQSSVPPPAPHGVAPAAAVNGAAGPQSPVPPAYTSSQWAPFFQFSAPPSAPSFSFGAPQYSTSHTPQYGQYSSNSQSQAAHVHSAACNNGACGGQSWQPPRVDMGKQLPNLESFSGKGVRSWLFGMWERLALVGHSWTTEQKLGWFGQHMKGQAQTWYQQMRLNPSQPQSLEAFAQALRKEFADPLEDANARSALSRLLQGGRTVSEYMSFVRSKIQLLDTVTPTSLSECRTEAEASALRSLLLAVISGFTTTETRETLLSQLLENNLFSLEQISARAATLEQAAKMATTPSPSDSAPSASTNKSASGSWRRFGSASASGSQSSRPSDAKHKTEDYTGGGGSKQLNASSGPPPRRPGFYTHPKTGKEYPIKDADGNPLCFYCLKYGHTKRDCSENPQAQQAAGN